MNDFGHVEIARFREMLADEIRLELDGDTWDFIDPRDARLPMGELAPLQLHLDGELVRSPPAPFDDVRIGVPIRPTQISGLGRFATGGSDLSISGQVLRMGLTMHIADGSTRLSGAARVRGLDIGVRRGRAASIVAYLRGVPGFVMPFGFDDYRCVIEACELPDCRDGSAFCVRKASGGSINRAEARTAILEFVRGLELGFGRAVSVPLYAAFSKSGELLAVRYREWSEPDRAFFAGWLAQDRVQGLVEAYCLARDGWGRWGDLDDCYGFRDAVFYLLRAHATSVTDYRARDLVIALERLVKHSAPRRDEYLADGVRRLIRRAGLDGRVSPSEVTAFVKVRNLLSHEGVVRLVERHGGSETRGLRPVARFNRWLSTFVLRIFVGLVGWQGNVRDFAAPGMPIKPIRSRRFAGPGYAVAPYRR